MIANGLFNKNRRKLYSRLPKNCAAILISNILYPKNGDQFFPFRQESNFFYLTGLGFPETKLILSKGKTENDLTEILFIQKPDAEKELWNGPELTIEKAVEITGIVNIKYLESWDEQLMETLEKNKLIYLDIEESEPPVYYYKNLLYNQLNKKFPNNKYENIQSLLLSCRLYKEPEEIEMIKQAICISKEAFLGILPAIKPGMYEYEIEAKFDYYFKLNKKTGHAFPPIIAGGINACTLHYVRNDSMLHDGDLLLMDFGAEFSYYPADCSRTIPVNGIFNQQQKTIYSQLLTVFNKAKQIIKPGITINQINQQVEEWLKEVHLYLGLYSKEEIAINPKLVKKYFPHGNSHFIGLDVHDTGSKDIVLEPGMVLTCEPGIYIHEKNLGIRIENDLLITRYGNEDLMNDFPLEIIDIERLMKKNNI